MATTEFELERWWPEYSNPPAIMGALWIRKEYDAPYHNRIGYTLEDGKILIPGAAPFSEAPWESWFTNVKDPGATAIPPGRYRLKTMWSNRFRKLMVAVMDVPEFTGIFVHGGNTAKDTLGCPLLGAATDPAAFKVWNCKVVNDRFRQMVRRYERQGDVWLTVSNPKAASAP